MGKYTGKRQLKGGSYGGAADYGVYLWGINQTAGQGGNIIQPVHDPRLFGQPVPQGTQGITGGSRRRRKPISGGMASTTISPTLVDTAGLLDQTKMSQIATDQMKNMMTPVIPNVSSDSVNPNANRSTVTGGKKKRRTKKKIYTKIKRHNGRHQRRTSKIR